MRTTIVCSVLALAVPVTATAAAPTVTMKSVECFYLNDHTVYTMKDPGRYEAGKFRCQGVVSVKGEGFAELPLALELRQKGRAAAQTSEKVTVSSGPDAKYELELPAPENYESCSDFELVLSLGSAKRSFKVKTSCPD
jgi:hypothetical protein